MKTVEIKLSVDVNINLQDGIQSCTQPLADKCSLGREIEGVQDELLSCKGEHKRKRKLELDCLRYQMRSVNRLNQILLKQEKENRSRRSKIYDTTIVEALIFQTEDLLGRLEGYLREEQKANKEM